MPAWLPREKVVSDSVLAVGCVLAVWQGAVVDVLLGTHSAGDLLNLGNFLNY